MKDPATLFGGLFSTPAMGAVWSGERQLQSWLDVEAAVARAEAELGLVPQSAADTIARHCVAAQYDLAALRTEMQRTGHALVPVLRDLANRCGDPAGQWVHHGLTTQDVLDTGAVLQGREARTLLLEDLAGVRASLAELRERHEDTVMVGRTHGQHALPITFGHKVKGWIDELDRLDARWIEARARLDTGNIGGAVGTLAALGSAGPSVARRTVELLGLEAPRLAWHVARDRVREGASLLAETAACMARIAGEVVALQRTEIAELQEPVNDRSVSSSTMPHKRNPSSGELVVALHRIAVGLLHALLTAGPHLHERDATGWRVEWYTLPELYQVVAASVDRAGAILEGLEVNADRMWQNLTLEGDVLLSERLAFALAPELGTRRAIETVRELILRSRRTGQPLDQLLREDERTARRVSELDLEALSDPATYLGTAGGASAPEPGEG